MVGQAGNSPKDHCWCWWIEHVGCWRGGAEPTLAWLQRRPCHSVLPRSGQKVVGWLSHCDLVMLTPLPYLHSTLTLSLSSDCVSSLEQGCRYHEHFFITQTLRSS